VRLHFRRITFLLALSAFGPTAAFASDIQCTSTRQPAERVICDHAILDNEYNDIYTQQQSLLKAGKLSAGEVAAWKRSRNACTDVHCIDGVFAQWKSMAKAAESRTHVAPAPPPTAQMQEMPEMPPSSPEVSSAASASAPSDASQVRTGSAAGLALPQPIGQPGSAPAAASSAASNTSGARMTGMSVGPLVVMLLAVVLAAIGAGVFYQLRKKK
jgi:uncharacterized protein